MNAPAPRSLIELRGVGVSYRGQPEAALPPLDLTVMRGELVVMTGSARSGRSTLLNVIGLLERPTTGTYLLNGLDTAKLGDRNRAALRGRHIGFVFQRPHLLPTRSALDNVVLPLLYTSRQRRQRAPVALDMLDRVGLAEQAQVMAGLLSVGEQQRVAIARALVTDPALVLCDDPTSSLDPATAAMIIGLLAEMHRSGRTILIATRDQLVSAYAARSVPIGAGHTALDLRSGW